MARPKEYTEERIRQEAKALIKYADEVDIPLEKEFAVQRGYSSQRISEFAKSSEEFSEALKKTKDIQEVKIVKAAMAGKINVTFAIFTLKNVSGWRDVQPISIQNDNRVSLLDIIKRVSVKETFGKKEPKDSSDSSKDFDCGYKIL